MSKRPEPANRLAFEPLALVSPKSEPARRLANAWLLPEGGGGGEVVLELTKALILFMYAATLFQALGN